MEPPSRGEEIVNGTLTNIGRGVIWGFSGFVLTVIVLGLIPGAPGGFEIPFIVGFLTVAITPKHGEGLIGRWRKNS